VPNLNFRVEGAEVLAFAAVPTLLFKLGIENLDSEPVCAVTLHTQIRIAATQRHYQPEEQARLVDVFGAPQRWADTLKSMLWTHTTVQVPPFSGSTVIDMPVPCTYDLEVVSVKYFHALKGGEVPLVFLFSGTIFYRGEAGMLQIVQISWEKEAQFRLPIGLWQQMMAHYFPNRVWLLLHQDTFDRLLDYKIHRGLPTWDAALERLLHARQAEELS
jgi:hypothetical protein